MRGGNLLPEPEHTIFAVENMSCERCSARVTKAIHALAPQSEVKVDLPTGAVTVTPALANPDSVARAITEAGYPAHASENIL
jgi:Cu+-exporting ATPase